MKNYIIVFGLQLALGQEESLSQDYLQNPDDYYRNPCPVDRPGGTFCNALDEYVWKKDDNYKWELKETYTDYPGVTGYAFWLQSQKWLNESYYYIENDHSTIWKHWVNIWVPNDKIIDRDLMDSALLLIDGGHNGQNPPNLEGDEMLAYIRLFTTLTGVISVSIKQIPNERLHFMNDYKNSRSEDSIIALTWRHFLDYPDQPEWLLRFPMVKASLRAMDMISDFAQTELDYPPISRWGVTGASKRGWTAWLVGATDPERVKMMMPIVLDCLNTQKSFHQMWENTGNWTFAMNDYWFEGINGRVDDPNMPLMTALIDPYVYRERLTMPKMIVSATGDEFFMPDDSYLWFDEMPGPTYFRMLPNSEHSTMLSGVTTPHYLFSARSLFISAMKGYPLPKMSWSMSDDPVAKTGIIELVTDQPPKNIYGWVGDNRSRFRRDYRLAGVRNNENGRYLDPEMPELPPGYPDLAPPGVDTSKFKRQDDEDLEEIQVPSDVYKELYLYMVAKNMTDLMDKFKFIHKEFDPSWQAPRLDPEEAINFQIQLNNWKKVMANKIDTNTYVLEFNEASDAFRAFFFEVEFQGPDAMHGFEFTSEVQIIPAARPFPPCVGEECQGGLI